MQEEIIDTATSYDFYKKEIREYLICKFDTNASVLDVGAGSGAYYNLLHDYFKNMDAVEIFKPNIECYKLEKKYNKVYNADICDLEYPNYDVIIFGDIIEHLDTNEAQKVLNYAYSKCKELIVAVPYLLEQDEYGGNIYEIHKQPDLTPLVVQERYPMLKLLYANDLYGYYVKGE